MAKKTKPAHTPEIQPVCSDFGVCGGCCYGDLSYNSELALKEKSTLELLSSADINSFIYHGIIPSPSPDGYKNKMEFTFGDSGKGGTLELGIRKKTSRYEVITPNGCTIIDSDFKAILNCVAAFFQKSGEPFYHKTSHTGTLRNLIIRKAHTTGEITANLVTCSGLGTDITALPEQLASLALSGKLTGVMHTYCNTIADFIKPESTKLLYGRDYITEKLLGLTFKISAFSFFQTNSLGAEVLYSRVCDYALKTGAKTIYDLYSGTGTISQLTASKLSAYNGEPPNVTGIELVAEAVETAKENAAANGVSCRFICADVLEALGGLNENPDLIIIDPPRAGIHPKALTRIIGACPSYIIYVSCNPATFARDLTALRVSRYEVAELFLMDMFPRTAHIESAALLRRKPL